MAILNCLKVVSVENWETACAVNMRSNSSIQPDFKVINNIANKLYTDVKELIVNNKT